MSRFAAEPAQIVGVDIGGTKTHIRAMPQEGGPVRDMTVPSAEWRVRNWVSDAARLLEIIASVVEGGTVAAIAIGAHGCDDAEECRMFEAALSANTSVPVAVVNDAELMPLALGFAGQIGVVAGTGSIAVCRPSPDRMLVAGGWGWIVGDDGSAAGLVREAVRAVSLHFDAGGTRGEPLVEAIFDTLKVPSIPRLGNFLSETRSAALVGRHAASIFEAAGAGSQLAHKVIRDGGRALARTAALLEARAGGVTHAVAGGSVIVGQPLLWQAFANGLIEETQGRIAPHLFTRDPVEGACRLAATTIGLSDVRGAGDAPSHS